MTTSGIEHDVLQFICPKCSKVNNIIYTYKESNKSIQARCICGNWIGNVKYDKRSGAQIRKDSIQKWLKNKEVEPNGAVTE